MFNRDRNTYGFILLELGLSQVIGALSLSILSVFFIITFHYFTDDMRRWSQIHSFRTLTHLFKDALNLSLAELHCGRHQVKPFIEILRKPSIEKSSYRGRDGIVLYSCRWLGHAWKWSKASYSIRLHQHHFYVYEKINAEPAEPWVLGIKDWEFKLLPYTDGKIKKSLLAMRLKWERNERHDRIKTILFSWVRNEK